VVRCERVEVASYRTAGESWGKCRSPVVGCTSPNVVGGAASERARRSGEMEVRSEARFVLD
jgi:hypothetical protein